MSIKKIIVVLFVVALGYVFIPAMVFPIMGKGVYAALTIGMYVMYHALMRVRVWAYMRTYVRTTHGTGDPGVGVVVLPNGKRI